LVKYIAKPDLIVGRKYRCLARNFDIGVWNGTAFDYLRTKFGQKFMDIEFHYDDGPPYGTVRPLELINE
jgi:hypothetical protein